MGDTPGELGLEPELRPERLRPGDQVARDVEAPSHRFERSARPKEGQLGSVPHRPRAEPLDPRQSFARRTRPPECGCQSRSKALDLLRPIPYPARVDCRPLEVLDRGGRLASPELEQSGVGEHTRERGLVTELFEAGDRVRHLAGHRLGIHLVRSDKKPEMAERGRRVGDHPAVPRRSPALDCLRKDRMRLLHPTRLGQRPPEMRQET